MVHEFVTNKQCIECHDKTYSPLFTLCYPPPPFFVETSKMSYNMHAFSLLHLHNTRVFGFDGRIADICVWLSQCDPYTEKTIRHFNDGVSSARLDLPKVRYAYFMLILEMKGIFYSLSTIPSLLFPFINARS